MLPSGGGGSLQSDPHPQFSTETAWSESPMTAMWLNLVVSSWPSSFLLCQHIGRLASRPCSPSDQPSMLPLFHTQPLLHMVPRHHILLGFLQTHWSPQAHGCYSSAPGSLTCKCPRAHSSVSFSICSHCLGWSYPDSWHWMISTHHQLPDWFLLSRLLSSPPDLCIRFGIPIWMPSRYLKLIYLNLSL